MTSNFSFVNSIFSEKDTFFVISGYEDERNVVRANSAEQRNCEKVGTMGEENAIELGDFRFAHYAPLGGRGGEAQDSWTWGGRQTRAG